MVKTGDKFLLNPAFWGSGDERSERKIVATVIGLYEHYALVEFAPGVRSCYAYQDLAHAARAGASA